MLLVVVAYVLVTTRHVAMSASAVAVSVALKSQADGGDVGEFPATVEVQCVIVVTSAIAAVASLGRQASLERDWVTNPVDDGETTTGECYIYIPFFPSKSRLRQSSTIQFVSMMLNLFCFHFHIMFICAYGFKAFSRDLFQTFYHDEM